MSTFDVDGVVDKFEAAASTVAVEGSRGCWLVEESVHWSSVDVFSGTVATCFSVAPVSRE